VSLSKTTGWQAQRPRFRSKWKYKLISIFLAILMVYLIYAAVKCAIMAAQQGGSAYQIMLFSLIVTYGGLFSRFAYCKTHRAHKAATVYTFSSLLAFDPWHMITSFIPYMLLSPTYINILNMYVLLASV